MQLCVEVTRAWIASVIELALLGPNVTLVARKAVMSPFAKQSFCYRNNCLIKLKKCCCRIPLKELVP